MDAYRKGLIVIVFALFLIAPASAQDARLTAEARKEGKAVVYGSLESEVMDEIIKALQKKTALPVDYWRASGASVTDRALTEYKTGKVLYDVVLTNAGPMEILLKEGIFAKYDSPTSKNFPKDIVHPQLGPRYREGVVGIVYNKGLLKPEETPRSLEDLLKPEYRGKLAFPDPTRGAVAAMWPASLYKIMGKERAEKFIRDLGATRPVIVEGVLNAAERVTTGETPIAITYLKYVVVFGQKGAPMDYVRLERMLGHGHYVALSNRSPRPNAGKAFIDFLLGDESMKIIAAMGEFVGRKGIYPSLPDADKIQVVEMDELDTAGFAEKRKVYRKIFLQ